MTGLARRASCRPRSPSGAHEAKQNRRKDDAMSMSNEEIKRRIEELQEAGMTLAARALIRELSYRERQEA